MHTTGWVGISWPQEYGGRGASFMQQVIFDEEYVRARASVLPGASGLNLLGPRLIHWGGDEQKRRHLPRILNADELWCQGFSEPDAAAIWRACAPGFITSFEGYTFGDVAWPDELTANPRCSLRG
jgi:alkylation response protein AidB-like acyl-CoA dehydrogenase